MRLEIVEAVAAARYRACMGTRKNEPSGPAQGASAAPARRGRPRASETFTISFRVDEAHRQRLARQADAMGVSPHEYARILVFQSLDQHEAVHFVEETQATHQAIRNLREDLAAGLEVILTNVTHADPAQVRSWIDTHLRQR